MFAWLLNFAYAALILAVSPWVAYRILVQRKNRVGWGEKLLGNVSPRTSGKPCLWFHAVSVGEVLQLQPVLELLAVQRPDCEFVISTTTTTGHDVARTRYPQHRVIYFPLDFSWSVRRALLRINPTAIVLVELELWPNFIHAAAERVIPVLLINGRISERSFRGYRRLRPIIRGLLRKLSVCAMQNETYAARLKDLGANSEHLHITGSIKFDRVQTDRRNSKTLELRRVFGLNDGERVFIAGSTQPPEERYAIESYLALREKHPDLRLILVPRHKERFDEVGRLVTDEFHLPLIRRSQCSRHTPCAVRHGTRSVPATLLLDTLGELSACWGLADVAFVGGSLTNRGGQNMIEPAGYGAAVLFGPNTQNFRDIVETLLSGQAAVVVRNPTELSQQLDHFLSHPEEAAAYGEKARQIVLGQRGATERTVELICRAIPAAAVSRAA